MNATSSVSTDIPTLPPIALPPTRDAILLHCVDTSVALDNEDKKEIRDCGVKQYNYLLQLCTNI